MQIYFAGVDRRRMSVRDVIITERGRHERNYWVDLWRDRVLFRVPAWRDLAVRYKQTVIGAAWAVIRQFLATVVFAASLQLQTEYD